MELLLAERLGFGVLEMEKMDTRKIDLWAFMICAKCAAESAAKKKIEQKKKLQF